MEKIIKAFLLIIDFLLFYVWLFTGNCLALIIGIIVSIVLLEFDE